MKVLLTALTLALSCHVVSDAQMTATSGFEKLDKWAADCISRNKMSLGYPGNNDIKLHEFYKWYTDNHLEEMIINNAGDPFSKGDHTSPTLSTFLSCCKCAANKR